MANKKVTNRERFVRVATQRTQKVIDDIYALSKCSATGIYEYTEEDVATIFGAIEEELQRAKDAFAGLNRFTLDSRED